MNAPPDHDTAGKRARSGVSPRAGYLFVALAAVLWAASGTAAKFLFNGGMDPFQLVQLRTTLAWVAMVAWLALRRSPFPRIAGRDWFYFAGLGVLGIAGAQFFYLFAISQIKVAAAILLHYLGPVFIALYAVVFARQHLGRMTLAAIATALIGCALVVEANHLDMLAMNRAGVIGGLCAALAFATYSVMGEYGMRRYDPWTVLCYAFLFAAAACNVIHPPLTALFQSYTAAQWGCILYIAVAGTVLPFGFYFEGINRIRSTHASITATLEPITAAAISWLALDETLAPLQIFGGLLVITAVVLLQTRRGGNGGAKGLADGISVQRISR